MNSFKRQYISMKLTVMILMTFPMLAQEIPNLRAWQPELSGSFSINRTTDFGTLVNVGGMADAGVSVHPNIVLLAEGNYVPVSVGGIHANVETYQGGVKLNVLTHGRFIPYFVGTAGGIRGSALGYIDVVFGYGLGGGLLMRITNHVDTKVDFRAFRSRYGNEFQQVAIGFGYRF